MFHVQGCTTPAVKAETNQTKMDNGNGKRKSWVWFLEFALSAHLFVSVCNHQLLHLAAPGVFAHHSNACSFLVKLKNKMAEVYPTLTDCLESS